MKSVTICASNRFAKEAEGFIKKLRKLGVTVYAPHFYTSNHGPLENVKSEHDRKFIAMGLTHDHFNKIRKADSVFVYNKGGYVGNSVTLEIGYAAALGKPIYVLSDKDDDVCRSILFSGVAETPEKLAKILR